MATNTDTIVDIESGESIELLQVRHDHTYNADVAESYLQELYRTECEFRISQDKVDLIQQYVESSVQILIQRVVASINTEDAYTETRLLKVGSFYEGTKNTQPDEFDFIYVLKEINSSSDKREERQLKTLSNAFHKRLQDIVKNHDVPGQSCEYIRLHGPASKLELHIPTIVSNEELDKVSIDISPAYRCLLPNDFRLDDLNVRFREWKQLIGSTGSFLKMQKHQNHWGLRKSVVFTVTESEMDYMLTIMSEKHKKVYRLLKLLINGNDGNDQLKQLLEEVPCSGIPDLTIMADFPSYAIKCLVFLHEQCCENNTSRVSDCILQVLGQFLKRFQDQFDHVSEGGLSFFRCNYTLLIRVEKVFGDSSLEVTDNFKIATDIAVEVSDMINRLRIGKESEHEKTEHISLSSRTKKSLEIRYIVGKKLSRILCGIIIFLLLFLSFVFGMLYATIEKESKTGIDQQTYAEAPHSNLSYFDTGHNSTKCFSSKETSSCSLPCKTYYCFPEQLHSDLEEIKNKSKVNVSMGEDEGLPVPLSIFQANYKDNKIDCCCLMLTERKRSFPGEDISPAFALPFFAFLGIYLFAVLWLRGTFGNQRQRYLEFRKKIVATLNDLEEIGIT